MATKKRRKVKKSIKILAGIICAMLVLALLLVIAIEAKNQGLQAVWERQEALQSVYDEEDTTSLMEIPIEGQGLERYRKEVSKRLENQEYFLKEDEISILKENGYELKEDNTKCIIQNLSTIEAELTLHYPVVYQTDTNVEIWYTSSFGIVFKKDISEKGIGEEVGNIHSSELILRATELYSVAYNSATGKVVKYSFGEIHNECEVPEDSLYTGFSYRMGYVFRNEDVIYLVDPNLKKVENIAEGVKTVIVADYYQNDIYWAQPLLQLEDGSIKVYTNKLEDPEKEGGY